MLKFIPLFFWALPAVASAQTFASIILSVVSVINLAIPLVGSLILCVFLWGIVQYVYSQSDSEKGKGKELIIWGLVGLFVAFSIWGIVQLFALTLGINIA